MSVKISSNADLFESGARAFVNTVNCEGVMGKGIALAFKKRYPEMFKEYVKQCAKGSIQVGKVWVWQNQSRKTIEEPEWIINFPTKNYWRNPSKLEWIETGLDDLRQIIVKLNLPSIAIPALGCSNGGLEFSQVRPLIEEKLNGIMVKTFIDQNIETLILLFSPQQ